MTFEKADKCFTTALRTNSKRLQLHLICSTCMQLYENENLGRRIMTRATRALRIAKDPQRRSHISYRNNYHQKEHDQFVSYIPHSLRNFHTNS